ncbi:MAG: precorrin-6y C5,15-methyltransferase (decarboxylating) subunit CbiE [Alphaproteobacteria bacterium]|nr:precorrin-6y C5,15-methyltransferase (decarboxylating) subunit CbiE [Alphaproteobacteria bacterium]
MTGPWLSVVGIGEDGLDGLSAAARALLDQAEIVIGGERHLAMLPDTDTRDRVAWPSPLKALVDRIESYRPRPVCVLASGDPFCFGIGTTLARRIGSEQMVVIPAPGARSLACARLGWPEHTTRLITLHGRPLALLSPHLQPGARLLILSEDGATPAQAAAHLTRHGFGESRILVLERMGGPGERRSEHRADELIRTDFDDLNTLAVELAAGPDARPLATVGGLPDDAFRHDGQMTKRETRAVTLSALSPFPGGLLWDVGAGCGSVSVEWMRADPLNRAVAIEPKAARRAMIAENAETLGVPGLEIVDGTAPDALDGLPEPDSIFVGGGASSDGVIDACWSALKPGGHLVANCVTLEGETELLRRFETLGGELIRLAVSRAEPVGPYHGWRSLMPVTQWRIRKPMESTS